MKALAGAGLATQRNSEMPSFRLCLTEAAVVRKLQEQGRIVVDRKLQSTTRAGAVLIQHNMSIYVNKRSSVPTCEHLARQRRGQVKQVLTQHTNFPPNIDRQTCGSMPRARMLENFPYSYVPGLASVALAPALAYDISLAG